MNQRSTAAESRYMGLVASMKCLICKRFPELDTGLPTEVHHLGEGSSHQNNWLVVPLCGKGAIGGHHRGAGGVHHMGLRAFIRLYRVPHDNEYGLLAWLQEDMVSALTARRAA